MNNKTPANTFARTFYVANTLEIFERIAWYGFFTVSSLYMSTSPSAGGLGFSDTERGILQGIIPFFVYVLPVITGAMGDRVGYRKMFLIAFALLTPSYLLLGQVHEFWPFFFVYMLVALGAAIFKPLVVGTVARSANDDNRGRAFGIFYMMVNVGGFLGPVIAGYVRAISWDHVFWLSSIAIGINLLIALFLLEDDASKRPQIVADEEPSQETSDAASHNSTQATSPQQTHEMRSSAGTDDAGNSFGHTDSTSQSSTSQSAASEALSDAIEVLGNGRFALMLIPIILGLMIAGGGWIAWRDYGVFLLFWLGAQIIWDRLAARQSSPERNPSSGQVTALLTAPWYRQKLRVGNAPFLVYLLVLSLFWAVYNQIFLTFPLYIQDFVDTSDAVAIAQSLSNDFAQFIAPVDTARLAEALGVLAVSQPEPVEAFKTLVQYQVRIPEAELAAGLAALSEGGVSVDAIASEWASKFRQVSPEYIIAFDFLSIVLFQYFISRWGESRAPFGMLILGTGMIGAAFVIGGVSHMVAFGGVLTIVSVIVFAFGEMFASPKSQEYVASTSSPQQAALFQGYYFVSIAIGYLLAGIMSGWAYGQIAIEANQPFVMWALFAGLAVLAMIALALFNRYLAPHMGAKKFQVRRAMTDVKTIAAGWEPSRVSALRDVMSTMKLDALVIPRWDEQQFEYVSLANERLAWITGFTGSWGLSIVTHDHVILFIDGRYPEQAARETNSDWVTLQHLYEEPPEDWLSQHAQAGWRVGFDSEVVTPDLYDRLQKVCEQKAALMQPIASYTFDQCWLDRPETPSSEVIQLSAEWAGESVAEKLARVREQMRLAGVAWLVETQPDNVNWLLNIRGQDLPYCPVVRARLLIGLKGEIHLFGNVADSDAEALASADTAIRCHAHDQFLNTLEHAIQPADCLWVDPTQGPQCGRQIAETVGGGALTHRSPITDLKARKNDTELTALRSACLSDSAVWVRLLHWLESAVHSEVVTELGVEERIHQFRTEVDDYTAPSFRTISAADGNASLAHYSAPADGGAILKPSTLFLLDSGGQFSRGGTTDTTRTWCFETPSSEHRSLATSVLKAHIAVAQQTFPVGTLGHALDSAARLPMWQAKLDYDHGTGHGVGHYLSVHEFPQRMQKAGTAVGLEAGMTLTVEPGFYRTDEFGIRHENLCEVVCRGDGWLGLESMAYVPFNRRLIDAEMLTPAERAWVDTYHQEVFDSVSPLLADDDLFAWLEAATKPLQDH